MKPVLSFTEKLCATCGDCTTACTRGCHNVSGSHNVGASQVLSDNHIVEADHSSNNTHNVGGMHRIDRATCIACGACVDACMPGALRIYGEEIDVASAAERLLEDADFYRQSGGGVTFSGGEPLLQPDFCAAVMRALKSNGIHIAVDTCGDIPWSAFEAVLPYTDLFLYDIKHISPQKHEEWTGSQPTRIAANLQELERRSAPCELRAPIIPGFNDDEGTLLAIGRLAASLSNVKCVRLLAYHDMYGGKYDSIGLRRAMPQTTPPTAQKMDVVKALLSRVCPNQNVCLSGD